MWDAGADCPWNATVNGLIVHPGYWRYSQETDALYKCVRSEVVYSNASSKAIGNVSNEASYTSSPCIGGVLGSQCALDAALCHLPIARSKQGDLPEVWRASCSISLAHAPFPTYLTAPLFPLDHVGVSGQSGPQCKCVAAITTVYRIYVFGLLFSSIHYTCPIASVPYTHSQVQSS